MKKRLFYTLALLMSLQAPLMAQDAEQPPRDQGFYQTLIMLAIIFVFFYFILWRPERKRRKVQEEQRSRLQKGDRVTAMGIIGTVSKVQEQTVILKMVDGSKIEVLKAAISDVIPASDEERTKAEREEK